MTIELTWPLATVKLARTRAAYSPMPSKKARNRSGW